MKQLLYDKALEDIEKNSILNTTVEGKIIKKEFKFNKEKLEINKDFCFVYCKPSFHSKYRLVANIMYILNHVITEVDPEFNERLFQGEGQNEYKKMIEGIKRGFEANYKLDKEDEKFLEEELTYFTKNKINDQVMHFVFMEQFFIVLDVLEEIRRELEKIHDQIKDQENSQKRVSFDTKQIQMNLLLKKKRQLELNISRHIMVLMDINIAFDKDS